ncbi:hypothetical protein JCM8547_002615 [Rhodosporidiobolus lusitaniae]
MPAPVPSVLVIGAGPAGIGAIEQFKRKGFEVVAFDARDRPGGLWNYTAKPPPCKVIFDANGFAVALSDLEHAGLPAPAPSPVYGSVTANTPSPIMNYRGHPYPEGTEFLPTREVIHGYLLDHAAKYKEHIRLNRVITRVYHTPSSLSPSKRWSVEWQPSVSALSDPVGAPTVEQFDYVVVANGSDSRPFIPYVEGLWHYKGEIMHSRWWRGPETYAGKNVLVVGRGPSSADIVRELGMAKVKNASHQPKQIWRSVRSTVFRYDTEQEKTWPAHVQVVGNIKLVRPPATVVLEDGTELGSVDVIVFATSFLARFEFLKPTDAPFQNKPLVWAPRAPESAVKPSAEFIGPSQLEGGRRVHNLDSLGIFYLPDPTLAFLLLHHEAIPWPFAEVQSRFVASIWSGQTSLDLKPSPTESSDDHAEFVLGHPGEYDYAENLLRLIGEGGEEEIDAEGRWGVLPAWKKKVRADID